MNQCKNLFFKTKIFKMFTIINESGKYLTNYGMQKFWFTDNENFAYTFDNIETAKRFADVYKCIVVSI